MPDDPTTDDVSAPKSSKPTLGADSDRRWRGERDYPTADGSITELGRRRQLAVAAWVLGLMGGPGPALLILLVKPGSGAYRKLVVTAACFWTAAVAIGTVFLLAGWGPIPTWIAWGSLLLVELAVTAIAVRHALRVIGSG